MLRSLEEGIREAVSADPLMFIKLQNHFVRSVKITWQPAALRHFTAKYELI